MKMKFIPVAALAIAFAFALYGCGGSGQSQSAAPADSSAAATSTVETSAPAATPADTSAAATVDTSEVNPELIAAGDQLKALADQYVAEVNKAIQAGDPKPYQETIDGLTQEITALINTITPLVPTDDPKDPNTVYYTKEIAPYLLGDYADAAFAYADMLLAELDK